MSGRTPNINQGRAEIGWGGEQLRAIEIPQVTRTPERFMDLAQIIREAIKVSRGRRIYLTEESIHLSFGLIYKSS